MTRLPVTTLAEVCCFVNGGTPKTSVSEYFRGQIPWITSADITEAVVSSARTFITPRAIESSATTLVPAGTVLLVTRTSVGKVAVAGADLCFSQDITAITPDATRLDAAYLVRFLQTQKTHLERLARGATIKGIPREVLDSLRIPLPPLSEQRRIASILDKADDLRTKRRLIADELARVPDALFAEMERTSDLSEWATVSLGDAFWFQEGPGVRNWQFRSEGIKLLNVGNIEKGGRLNLTKTTRHIAEDEFATRYRHFGVDAGDFVIASSGISFDEDGFLRTRGAFVQPHHLPLCMNTSTIRFKALEGKSNLRFLAGWLNSLAFRSQITRLVTGSAQQNFGPSHLRSIRISLPPLAVQEVIAEKFAAVERLRDAHTSSLATMDEFFMTLQHCAFDGEL